MTTKIEALGGRPARRLAVALVLLGLPLLGGCSLTTDYGFTGEDGGSTGMDSGPRDAGRDSGPCTPTGTTDDTCDFRDDDCDGRTDEDADTSADPSNCGACGTVCNVANGTAGCAAGSCTVAACDTGFGNCDGSAANGCETDTTMDPSHCGTCGTACMPTGGEPACVDSVCTLGSCDTGFADCDGDDRNGCEVNTQTDEANCGGCDIDCGAGPRVRTSSCDAGVCSITDCDANFEDCDSDYMNGCEVDVRSNVMNCGSCGNVCMTANGTPGCGGGTCTVAMCDTGFGNCDMMAANGCEADVSSDIANCGACLAVCAPANASGVCASSMCTIGGCIPGFGDCNTMPTDGCEANLNTSATNCGMCGRACGANTTCASGVCACATNFADCNSDLGMAGGDGCETDLRTSHNNCGACGTACTDSQYCNARSCSNCTGPAGRDRDCDLNGSNACETNTSNNPDHCGMCGNVCPAGMRTCSGGTCG